MAIQPLTVWLTPSGPNPWKVVLILEELGVPYEIESFKFDHVKDKPYIDICPNGRVPAIVDPNTNLTLWESGAIIQYLEETYDTEKELTYESLNERHLLNQYLHFQMSGQGPYYGQSGWFNVLHPERLPSVIERYNGQVRRVLSVLETLLGGGKTWLVGDKCTFADLSFMPWNTRLDFVLMTKPGEDPLAPYPNVQAWHRRMVERPAWKRAMAVRDKLMDDQGLMPNGMPKGINNIKEYEEYMEKLAAEAQEPKQVVRS
ncbi:glutathione S-transferase family protein [Aspergillus aculeatinus CBS 121060]|uniref:Glutathione S-transferase n=1 Tax=Aspergillus aculeatinus CBS 121060 TaxID=1448322 RepID=A0ACD1GUT1_9EURO|nr:glutathione S-transferase [Aspergillus aculeatinus CBS 121060]RAH65218.1 glutathione S-transferase [Aspergillus aculeatinus CBS 121060]